MIEIEIDGRKITVEEGASIIEAADQAKIYIPRFCYHEKLSIAANCRMCLVEVEKAPKAVPACATPVTANMRVFTQSEKTLEAQRAVMEFLLINHPLDCPICDQGGACELQDLAMGYGAPYSYYEEGKRAVFNDNLGPLIATEMTRCIQCTRCVRFGEEIAGQRELGVVARGEKERITTYIKHFVKSELSGNIIDICPVGALTAKPSRYRARDWEMREHPMIAPHDCVGSNIYIHSAFREYQLDRPVMRTVARRNDAINETWISDQDRFSYEGLYHEQRVYQPKIKINGAWQECEWQAALQEIVQRLLPLSVDREIAAIATPNATLEEFYLLQKLLRSLGSHHIDYRVRELDFNDQKAFGPFPGFCMNIADIAALDTILLIGADIKREQPLISHRIFQAFSDGAMVMAVNPMNNDFPYTLAYKMIDFDILNCVAQLVKVFADEAGKTIPVLRDIVITSEAKNIAAQLKTSKNKAIFLGNFAMQHPKASILRQLSAELAQLSGAQLNFLTDGANCAGAWLAGAVPHRAAGGEIIAEAGRHARALLTTQPANIYFLLNTEPEYDTAYPAAALKALHQAQLVVCLTTYVTPMMQQYADIILPVAPFTEIEGTYINVAGMRQEFSACSVPVGESKPGWKIIRALAGFLKLEGFDFKTIAEVRAELQEKYGNDQVHCHYQMEKIEPWLPLSKGTYRLASWPMYRGDNLVRRAKALQETLGPATFGVEMSLLLAQELGVQEGMRVLARQGDSRVILPVFINNDVDSHFVIIRSGLEETVGFGEAMTTIQLEKEVQ